MFPSYLVYVIWLIVPLAIWEVFWKTLGLWYSARKNEKAWFIVFVFINLLGVLEIYYLHSRRCWPFRRK